MTLQRECNLLGLGVRRGESGRRQLKLVGERTDDRQGCWDCRGEVCTDRSATTRASKLLHTVHFWNQAEIVKCRAQQADLVPFLHFCKVESKPETLV